MKNVFSLLICCLTANFVFGQIEWVGNHAFSESASDVFRTSQNQYVLVHGTGNGITVFDAAGNIIFSKTLNPTETGQNSISDIMELPDSSIAISVRLEVCDAEIREVHVFDKNWEETGVFDNEYCTGPAGHFSDNSFVVASREIARVARFDLNGTIWVQEALSFQPIYDLVVTPDDFVFLAMNLGLVKMDINGEIVDTLSNLLFTKIDILPDGNFLASSDSVLYLYSPDFSLLNEFPLFGETATDWAIGSDEIAVLTSSGRIKRLGIALDSTEADLVLTGEHQTFKALELTQDGCMVGGGENFGNSLGGSFIKAYNWDGTTANTAKDANISQIEMGPIGYSGPLQEFGLYNVLIPFINATVKNEGTSTINSLTLNIDFPSIYYSFCVDPQDISKTFENMNLSPGASMTLEWGEQFLTFNNSPGGQTMDVCVIASLPDNYLDADNTNDGSCTSQYVSASNEPHQLGFHHYFNPVSDELIVEIQPGFDLQNSELWVFNTASQMVIKSNISQPREAFDLSLLPDGGYFLRILSGGKQGWRKFAKY
ncbi:MAG: T9SS type A sorting domain-containing protein [Saprospiraceae bacterium]|nr:T9SS type A sorting domain-containing protein [Saprospiraceae bacterium]